MSCSCRLTSLRIFVQGLSQVHKAEGPSPSFLRFRSQLGTSTRYHAQLATVRQARQLHASRRLNQDTESSASPIQPVSESGESLGKTHDDKPVQQARSQELEGHTSANAPYSDTIEATDVDSMHIAVPKKRNRKPESPRWQDNDRVRSFDKPSRERRDWRASKASQGADDAILEPPPGEPQRKRPLWAIQKEALKQKFPEGWKPRKRLSPDALAGIRALNAQFPDVYTTEALANKFEVSAENIRRILKSKWLPSAEEETERQERWHRRGTQIWERRAALGVKPPRKWREEGITRDPSYNAWRKEASRKNKEWEENEDREYRASLQSRVSGKVL